MINMEQDKPASMTIEYVIYKVPPGKEYKMEVYTIYDNKKSRDIGYNNIKCKTKEVYEIFEAAMRQYRLIPPLEYTIIFEWKSYKNKSLAL